jgi:plastocyanin
MRNAAIAATAVALMTAPALAHGWQPAADSATMRATDPNAWKADGTGASTLTITTGGTVTFTYPSGTMAHNVRWLGKKPACSGVPDESAGYVGSRPPWTGTFADAGTYQFECAIHAPLMEGSIVVQSPAASATPTPTATTTPTPTPTPDAGGTPGPSGTTPTTQNPNPQADQQRTLKVTLATSQKGTRVRGSVDVARAGSRLEITLKAGKQGVGRYLKRSATSGANAFSVALDQRGKRMLKRHHALKVKVGVAITPPGGAKIARTVNVKLRG